MEAPQLSEEQAAALIVAARELTQAAFNEGNARAPAQWAKHLEGKAAKCRAVLKTIPAYGAVELPDPANVRQDRST